MGWLSVIAVIALWGHATQGCTIITLDDSGFASNAYSLLHALPIFYRRNGTFFLDNSDFNYRCSENGGWHEFFSGEDKIVPWSRPKELAHGPDCARFRREDVDAIMHALTQSKPEPLDFIGIKMAWRYRPWVQKIIDQQMRVLAKQKTPTIGFHIRGGDLLRQDTLKTRALSPVDIVQTFAQAFPLVKGGTCVIVGDEHARVTEAAQAAERHLRCKVLRTSPFWSKDGFSKETYNEQGLDAKCSGTVKMLIDLELLAHTDYLVASDQSRWSQVLQYMRYILYDKDRSTFVDASADHADLYSTIRKYIRPDSFTVTQSAAGGPGPEHRVPTAQKLTKKAGKKGKKAPMKLAQPPPPPPRPEAVEDYSYEDEEDFEDF